EFIKRGGHRLFGDRVTTEFHRPDDVLMMRRVDGGDDHCVRFGLGDHAVKIRREVGRAWLKSQLSLKLLVVPIHAGLAKVAKSDQFGNVTVSRGQRLNEHARSCARSYNDVTFFIHLLYPLLNDVSCLKML